MLFPSIFKKQNKLIRESWKLSIESTEKSCGRGFQKNQDAGCHHAIKAPPFFQMCITCKKGGRVQFYPLVNLLCFWSFVTHIWFSQCRLLLFHYSLILLFYLYFWMPLNEWIPFFYHCHIFFGKTFLKGIPPTVLSP